MSQICVERLGAGDVERARALFLLVAGVFETETGPLSDGYLERMLAREDFWAIEATADGRAVGGLTAFTLPLTRKEELEIFLYDIAVLPEFQRRGVGRELVAALRRLAAAAGIATVFVPADNQDTHALDFYRALGGEAAEVTIFTFGGV